MSCESLAGRVPAQDVEPEMDAERCRNFFAGGWWTLQSHWQSTRMLSVCLSVWERESGLICHSPLVSKPFPSLSDYHLVFGVPTWAPAEDSLVGAYYVTLGAPGGLNGHL